MTRLPTLAAARRGQARIRRAAVVALAVTVTSCGAAGAAWAEDPREGSPPGGSAIPGETRRGAGNPNGSNIVVLIGANDYGFADPVPSRSPG